MARSLQIITTESSPYLVPAGKRVLSFGFVGDTGGGSVTITNSAGEVSDAADLDEGESFGLDFPPDGVPILGENTSFAWTGIAHYAVVIL
jgi:hypothetical protein